MKIIIPMAGLGKRMRPHTLTMPKPLIPVAGKAIVQHLVEDIIKVCHEKADEIAFVVAPSFGTGVEKQLVKIAILQWGKNVRLVPCNAQRSTPCRWKPASRAINRNA